MSQTPRGDFGPKVECIQIFIEIWPRLTMSPKLPRYRTNFNQTPDLQGLGDMAKCGQNSRKIGVHSFFGPRSPRGVWGIFAKNNLGWPALQGFSPLKCGLILGYLGQFRLTFGMKYESLAPILFKTALTVKVSTTPWLRQLSTKHYCFYCNGQCER